MHDALLLLARLLAMTFFATELYDKVVRFSAWVEVVAQAGMPVPAVEMGLVVALLAIGSLSLLTGYQMTFGIGCLLLFLAPTALIFESTGGALRCVSIAGGLLALLVAGPGRYSLQAWWAA